MRFLAAVGFRACSFFYGGWKFHEIHLGQFSECRNHSPWRWTVLPSFFGEPNKINTKYNNKIKWFITPRTNWIIFVKLFILYYHCLEKLAQFQKCLENWTYHKIYEHTHNKMDLIIIVSSLHIIQCVVNEIIWNYSFGWLNTMKYNILFILKKKEKIKQKEQNVKNKKVEQNHNHANKSDYTSSRLNDWKWE